MSKMSRKDELSRLESENVARTLRGGPGLKYGYNTWIEARDRKRRQVLLAGLGGMGIGRMWFHETDHHKNMPEYEDAPEQPGRADEKYPFGFWP
jgi:hypothetical protein